MTDSPKLSSMRMLRPPRLRPGDLVGVVSPAGPLKKSKLQNLDRGVRYLENQGYHVLQGRHVCERQGYLAGSDEMRAADLNDMFRQPDVSAIFCTRGGYGITRLLDRIDYHAVQTQPKILVGYSDITALQLALIKKTGLVSFSGPMVAVELGDALSPLTAASMWTLLNGKSVDLFESASGAGIKTMAGGRAVGLLLGGCLSVLVSLLGTPYMPDMNGAILLLEDIGEDLYKIDRSLSQLKNAGILDAANGVLLGQFLDIAKDDNDPPMEVMEVFDYYLRPLGVPVLYNIPYGHGPIKLTLPLGCPVELDADAHHLRMLQACLA